MVVFWLVITRDMILRPLEEGIFALVKISLKIMTSSSWVNDTNIGPMRDLSQVFQEMADKQLDLGFPLRRARGCY